MPKSLQTKTVEKTGAAEPRLSVAAWVNAALDVLAHRGVEAIRVETLCTTLKVTKGSFYWHFKTRQALLDAVLAEWRRSATLGVIERLSKRAGAPAERLLHLLRLPFHGRRSGWGADVELAIRLWGRHDRRAQQALQEVDHLRLHYIGQLLEETGVPAEFIPARAILLYSYMRVAASLIANDDVELLKQCEDLLVNQTI